MCCLIHPVRLVAARRELLLIFVFPFTVFYDSFCPLNLLSCAMDTPYSRNYSSRHAEIRSKEKWLVQFSLLHAQLTRNLLDRLLFSLRYLQSESTQSRPSFTRLICLIYFHLLSSLSFSGNSKRHVFSLPSLTSPHHFVFVSSSFSNLLQFSYFPSLHASIQPIVSLKFPLCSKELN